MPRVLQFFGSERSTSGSSDLQPIFSTMPSCPNPTQGISVNPPIVSFNCDGSPLKQPSATTWSASPLVPITHSEAIRLQDAHRTPCVPIDSLLENVLTQESQSQSVLRPNCHRSFSSPRNPGNILDLYKSSSPLPFPAQRRNSSCPERLDHGTDGDRQRRSVSTPCQSMMYCDSTKILFAPYGSTSLRTQPARAIQTSSGIKKNMGFHSVRMLGPAPGERTFQQPHGVFPSRQHSNFHPMDQHGGIPNVFGPQSRPGNEEIFANVPSCHVSSFVPEMNDTANATAHKQMLDSHLNRLCSLQIPTMLSQPFDVTLQPAIPSLLVNPSLSTFPEGHCDANTFLDLST